MGSNSQLSETTKSVELYLFILTGDLANIIHFILDYLKSTPKTGEILQYNGNREKNVQIKDTLQDNMYNL